MGTLCRFFPVLCTIAISFFLVWRDCRLPGMSVISAEYGPTGVVVYVIFSFRMVFFVVL